MSLLRMEAQLKNRIRSGSFRIGQFSTEHVCLLLLYSNSIGTHCCFGLTQTQGSGTKMKKLASLVLFAWSAATAADIRLGIIGTDTSHVVVFTQMFNDPSRPDHVPGARVVAAFKGAAAPTSMRAGRVS